MIARIMGGEGQFEISDEVHARLNELDEEAAAAVDAGDEQALHGVLGRMVELVETEGERLPEAYLGASDLVIPPEDLSLDEAKRLFTEEGLIPDIPVA